MLSTRPQNQTVATPNVNEHFGFIVVSLFKYICTDNVLTKPNTYYTFRIHIQVGLAAEMVVRPGCQTNARGGVYVPDLLLLFDQCRAEARLIG